MQPELKLEMRACDSATCCMTRHTLFYISHSLFFNSFLSNIGVVSLFLQFDATDLKLSRLLCDGIELN